MHIGWVNLGAERDFVDFQSNPENPATWQQPIQQRALNRQIESPQILRRSQRALQQLGSGFCDRILRVIPAAYVRHRRVVVSCRLDGLHVAVQDVVLLARGLAVFVSLDDGVAVITPCFFSLPGLPNLLQHIVNQQRFRHG